MEFGLFVLRIDCMMTFFLAVEAWLFSKLTKPLYWRDIFMMPSLVSIARQNRSHKNMGPSEYGLIRIRTCIQTHH